jgi:hypothetical protein
MPSQESPDQGRAYDERGNVRPADPRWLPATEEPPSPPPPYEDWLADDLREELERRGLPKSGNKAELVARLEANDAEPPVPF